MFYLILSIITVSPIVFYSNQIFLNLLSKYENITTLIKLSNQINLAKSTAIVNQEIVHFNPYNLKFIHDLKYGEIHLRCFGNSSNFLTILPNGSTYNNGHISYFSHHYPRGNYRALYFNKALRIKKY